ncbi:MAG: acetyltransferase [Candidatus Lambdaproteobacteria bacterium]|nr:acetyltransferase [Candidatus Lambdaproteobacteria bacterium]
MTRYDVFNGDADGLCALHQLRLEAPAESVLVTGVKRDTRLLAGLRHVRAAEITVLDVALVENRAPLLGLLERGCRVRYFDHHEPGEIPQHPLFEPHLDTSPEVCTSLLVDRHLGGSRRVWAVVAAFGDNLGAAARRAALPLGLGEAQLAELSALGELLNYNGYGETLADLHHHPADLYRALAAYVDPLAFHRDAPEVERLRRGFVADLSLAAGLEPIVAGQAGRVYRFPAAPWARRVLGIFANRAANAAPGEAVATLAPNADGTLRVSVRAPLARPQGCDRLCRRFAGGGGRAGAGGINSLPEADLPRFSAAFEAAFQP